MGDFHPVPQRIDFRDAQVRNRRPTGVGAKQKDSEKGDKVSNAHVNSRPSASALCCPQGFKLVRLPDHEVRLSAFQRAADAAGFRHEIGDGGKDQAVVHVQFHVAMTMDQAQPVGAVARDRATYAVDDLAKVGAGGVIPGIGLTHRDLAGLGIEETGNSFGVGFGGQSGDQPGAGAGAEGQLGFDIDIGHLDIGAQNGGSEIAGTVNGRAFNVPIPRCLGAVGQGFPARQTDLALAQLD